MNTNACNRPLTIQGGIRIQNRTVCIRKRTLLIRVPAVKDIALIGVLLYLRCIGRSVTDIVVRRGRYIGRIVCADPLILNFDSRYIGHPVGLSCFLALPNDQTLWHFPARNENAICIRLRSCSRAICVSCIMNELRTDDIRFFNRYIFTVNLDRFRSACPRIRRNHINIPAFLGSTAALYQIDIIICTDYGIIPQIEGSTYINTIALSRKPRFIGQRVVVVLDNASCHGIGTTADTTAYICNIVFNGTVGLFNRGCGP